MRLLDNTLSLFVARKRWGIFFILIAMLTACGPPPPPQQPQNICAIFMERPSWYWDAKATQKKWGIPVSVQMAVMYQESSYQGNAKPPRGKILWVIPWKRPTSATGYSQAIDNTWLIYQKETGNLNAQRDSFKDASDFIGWYAERAHRRAGISYYNAYAFYLAYHEGIGYYQRGSYQSKPWLLNIAKKVQTRANRYQAQLGTCEGHIPKPWW